MHFTALNTRQSTQYTVHSTLYTLDRVHSTQYTVHTRQTSKVHGSPQGEGCGGQAESMVTLSGHNSTLYNGNYSVDFTLYTLYTVQCATV